MIWTVETITDLLHEKPELLGIIDIIQSFPEKRKADAIRAAVEFLNSKQEGSHDQ